MFITNLLNKIFNADQTPSNTVSWSGTNGLKLIQDDIVEEIRARGCVVVPDTVALNAQGKNNSQTALVVGVGIYTWQSSGTENGKLVVAANDGGYWYLQANGGFIPNVVTAPATPTNGVVLYSEGGVLKYKNSAGTVKTINTTP
jgi:hypothetical protein